MGPVTPIAIGACAWDQAPTFSTGVQARVCEGELWDLPDWIERSPYGHVVLADAVWRDIASLVDSTNLRVRVIPNMLGIDSPQGGGPVQ